MGLQGAYCGQHKLKDMERVNTRRCSAEGCDKRASFNVPGQPAQYCGQHKSNGMVDVANRRCEADGCHKVRS